MKAGYAHYVAAEAAKMGAVGTGTLGAFGFFQADNLNALTFPAGQVLGGLLGYAAVNHFAAATIMGLGQTAAALAVGSLAIVGGLIVLAIIMGAVGIYCMAFERVKTPLPG